MDHRPLVIPTNGHRQIVLPSLVRLLPSKQQMRARERLLRGHFFLINMRLGNLGEVFRCGRCNGKHERLTKYCIERPFSGLLGALYGYVTTLEQGQQLGVLPPVHQARVDALRQLFGAAPDLAGHHPGLARQLAMTQPGDSTRPPGAVDLDVGMIALGVLERIDAIDAQRLLNRINVRAAAYHAPRLVVPGLVTREG